MIELSMDEACNELDWYGSWSENVKYDAEKKELTIEIEWRKSISDDLLSFLKKRRGSIIFHGANIFQKEHISLSERVALRVILTGCLMSGAKRGLSIEGYAYNDAQYENYDWFSIRFFADSATWHPKNL